ncbi:EthD domain-containing protein [Roseiarcaceae bacterium H3SJ34-1]|uniref:EthD domain-containing protein n=1 Tax=Terripilifer ovatus TaxID=3032367 RepID=UPI003AB9B545|nr:EthD domain-containing protein [Roseiarcaceae bacterium H3SJ34-1]
MRLNLLSHACWRRLYLIKTNNMLRLANRITGTPAMVDLIVLLKRTDAIGRDEFLRRWADASAAAYKEGADGAGVIQCRVTAEPPPLPGMPTIGVSIDAFEKLSFAEVEQFANCWRHAEALAELRSIAGAMSVLSVRSHVVRDDTKAGASAGFLKRMVLVKRNPKLARQPYLEHWLNTHARLARQVRGGSRFYIQHEVLSELENPGEIASLALSLDGFSETWYDDEAEMSRAAATAEGQAVARDNLAIGGESKRFFFEISNQD